MATNVKSFILKCLKWSFVIVIISILLITFIYFLLPKKPKDLMKFDDPFGKERPLIIASKHAVVAGTPWATEAAMDILNSGGNAYDAAIAGLFMLYVTHGEASGFPGIAPMMLYQASKDTITSYIGVGTAPKLATIEKFKQAGHDVVPSMDIYAQLLPGGPDAIFSILKEYGTMSLSQLIQPAIQKATEGFPVHKVMQQNLDLPLYKRIGYSILMPYNARIYLDSKPWKPLYLRERFTRPDLAKTFTLLAKAEEKALKNGKSRIEAINAARAYFYKGPIADAISEMHLKKDGLIRKEDLASYKGKWEKAYHGRFNEYELYVNGPWSQGMTLIMALHILNQLDVKSLGHNSSAYIHTVTQAIELVMSDREAYFGDPDFIDVPSHYFLDSLYGIERSKELTTLPFSSLPLPSNIKGYTPYISKLTTEKQSPKSRMVGDDTSQIIVADSIGNVIAITPSDFPMTPMVKDWDLTMGNRMNQFRLDSGHPAGLVPGKRPRVTPQAVMIRKNGDFYMAINTPGGDNQIQAILQVLLNHFIFGDDIQTAIERPRFKTLGFPGSFSPHPIESATLEVEKTINAETIEQLKELGYKINLKERWGISSGVGAIMKTKTGYEIGADPRAETIAAGK